MQVSNGAAVTALSFSADGASLAIGLVLGIAVARTAVNLFKCMADTCGTHHPDDVEGHMQFQASFYAADIDTDTNTAPKPDAESKNLPFPQDEE